MRKRLHRARQRAHRAVQRVPSVVLVVVAMLVLSSAGVAAQSVLQADQTDTFEDGNADGWRVIDSGTQAGTQNVGAVGNVSLYVTSDTTPTVDNPTYEWVNGPVLDLNESFTVEGVMRYNANPGVSAETVRIGLSGQDQEAPGENVFLLFDYGAGETRIGTYIQDTSGEAISRDFRDTWVRFELRSTGDGTLQAKVWEVGSAEPGEYQIERSGFAAKSGSFGVNPGDVDDAQREIWLDGVTVEGTLAVDPSLQLQTRQLYRPGETHSYEVRELRPQGPDNRNISVDVTDNATVTPLNASVFTVNANNTITAAENVTPAEYLIRASYNGSTTYKTVTVAQPTVENLGIVPGLWRVNAVISDSTLFAILIAGLVAVVGTRMTTAWGGLAMGQMAVVVGWLGGYVGFGIAAVGLFTALFIGLNLAANIDYTNMGGFARR